MSNSKCIMYRTALLGSVVLQLFFSNIIFAADASEEELSPAKQIAKLQQQAIADIDASDFIGAHKAVQSLLNLMSPPVRLGESQMGPVCRACVACGRQDDFLKAGDKMIQANPDSEQAIKILVIHAIAYAYFENMPALRMKLNELRTQYSSHEKLPDYMLIISAEYWAAKARTESIQLAEEVFEKYPEHKRTSDALHYLIMRYVQTNNLSAANQMLNQLRTRYGSHQKFPEYFYHISNAYYTRSTRSESVLLTEEFLEKYPEHKAVPEALAKMAIRYREMNNRSASKQMLNRLRTKYSSHERFPEFLTGIGRWYGGQEAIQLFEEVVENYPKHEAAAEALKELVARYQSMGKSDVSKQMLNQLRTQYSSHEMLPGYLTYISGRYWRAGAKDESIQLAEEIFEKYPAPWILKEMVTRYASMNNWTVSLQKADQLLSQYLHHKSIANLLRTVNQVYQRTTNHEAKNWLNSSLISLIHNGQDSAAKIQALKICILVFDEQTAFKTIAGNTESNLVNNYSADDVRVMLSHCQEKNKFSLAVKLCQEYLNGKPKEQDRKKIELLLFTNWFFSGDDPMPLLPHLDKYIQGNNSNDKALTAQAIILKGRILMLSGDVGVAITLLKEAVEEYPDVTEIQEGLYLLGYGYLLQNEFDRSREIFNEYLKKYPANINASEARKLIKRIDDFTTL